MSAVESVFEKIRWQNYATLSFSYECKQKRKWIRNTKWMSEARDGPTRLHRISLLFDEVIEIISYTMSMAMLYVPLPISSTNIVERLPGRAHVRAWLYFVNKINNFNCQMFDFIVPSVVCMPAAFTAFKRTEIPKNYARVPNEKTHSRTLPLSHSHEMCLQLAHIVSDAR